MRTEDWVGVVGWLLALFCISISVLQLLSTSEPIYLLTLIASYILLQQSIRSIGR